MEYITIRSLQHYLYCPHRWGLIEIDRAWAENSFVVKANTIHKRAHSGENYYLRGKRTYTDVDIWNDNLGIIGKTDCLVVSDTGICIVEYKPTKPKTDLIRHEDAMQLYAQKLCVDELFKMECTAQIYYADVKRNYSVTFDSSFNNELSTILAEMRDYVVRGVIPPIRAKQVCNGCSMKDMCMPQIMKRNSLNSVKAFIMKEYENEKAFEYNICDK